MAWARVAYLRRLLYLAASVGDDECTADVLAVLLYYRAQGITLRGAPL